MLDVRIVQVPTAQGNEMQLLANARVMAARMFRRTRMSLAGLLCEKFTGHQFGIDMRFRRLVIMSPPGLLGEVSHYVQVQIDPDTGKASIGTCNWRLDDPRKKCWRHDGLVYIA